MAGLIDSPQAPADFTEAAELLLDQALDLKSRRLEVHLHEIDLESVSYDLSYTAEILYEILEDLATEDLDAPVRRREVAGEITGLLVRAPKARREVSAQLTSSNGRHLRVTQAIDQVEASEDDPGEATDRLVTSLLDLTERELHQVSEVVLWHAGSELS